MKRMRIWTSSLFLFLIAALSTPLHAFITLDVADLALISSNLTVTSNLTLLEDGSNIISNYTLVSNYVKNMSIVDSPYEKMEMFPLPNAYLTNANLADVEKETPYRRFDVLFFVTVPITYYLMSALVDQKNKFFENNRTVFNSTDYVTVLINTILIPMGIAYFDFIYVQSEEQKKKKAGFSPGFSYQGPGFGMNFACLEF